MAKLHLRLPVECPSHQVRELLLDEAFLDAFVNEQHPTVKKISVDRDRQVSTSKWTIRLDGDLPAIVTRFVGRSAALVLVFDLKKGKMTLEATARRDGKLISTLRIEDGDAGGAVLVFDGDVTVSGAFGGMAEGTVKDQVIVPVLTDDLARLLGRHRPDAAASWRSAGPSNRVLS